MSSEHDEGVEACEENKDSDGEEPAEAPSDAALLQDQTAENVVKRVRRRRRRVVVNTSKCRYDIVREAVAAMCWHIEDEEHESAATASPQCVDYAAIAQANVQSSVVAKWKYYTPNLCQIFWTDLSVLVDRVTKLQGWQRINHFPRMDLITRKMSLSQQLGKMQKILPEAYRFYPMSFLLRSEKSRLTDYLTSLKGAPKTFLLKPNAGCQGAGIVLTRDPLRTAQALDAKDEYIVQVYVHRPLLIDNRKFDMRIYVLVLSVSPLLLGVHREGLVRMCATEYHKPSKQNLSKSSVHLTNYAINKHESNFSVTEDGEEGFKRDFHFLEKFIDDSSDGVAPKRSRWRETWQRIDSAIVLTLLSAYPELQYVYNASTKCGPRVCFELLGFDVLLDRDLNPHVLEVNHSPSLFCDAALDNRIKRSVLVDLFKQLDPYLPDIRKTHGALQPPTVAMERGTKWRQVFPPLPEDFVRSSSGDDAASVVADAAQLEQCLNLYNEAEAASREANAPRQRAARNPSKNV